MRFAGSLLILCSATALVLAGGSTPRREDVPKYLTMLLKSTAAKDRATAAEMLGKRGAINRKDVEEAIDPLKKALQMDVDSSVRAAAARALGNISPDPKEIIPLFIEALQDKSVDVKIATMIALGQYGSDATAAVTHLRVFAKDKDKDKDKKLAMTAGAAIKSITAKVK